MRSADQNPEPPGGVPKHMFLALGLGGYGLVVRIHHRAFHTGTSLFHAFLRHYYPPVEAEEALSPDASWVAPRPHGHPHPLP